MEPPKTRRLILHNLSLWCTKAKKLFSDQAADVTITPESHVLEDGTIDILNFLALNKNAGIIPPAYKTQERDRAGGIVM
eukprot:1990230-Pyramimonas_sp.AAC.1